jgi:hypothetical protein
MNASTNLPSVQFDSNAGEGRLIRGDILKCVDGRWAAKDGTTFQEGEQFLVLGTNESLQCWKDGLPSETIVKETGKSLPDVDLLNEKIPEKKWKKGLDNKPRPPWQHQWVAYLIRCVDAAAFTFINSTVGARLAVERLADQVQAMRTLRGAMVVPLVTLGSKPMPTSYGDKLRPHFQIVEWRELAGGVGVQQQPAPAQIEAPKEQKAKATKPGKPIKPVTSEEALNDKIPW